MYTVLQLLLFTILATIQTVCTVNIPKLENYSTTEVWLFHLINLLLEFNFLKGCKCLAN